MVLKITGLPDAIVISDRFSFRIVENCTLEKKIRITPYLTTEVIYIRGGYSDIKVTGVVVVPFGG